MSTVGITTASRPLFLLPAVQFLLLPPPPLRSTTPHPVFLWLFAVLSSHPLPFWCYYPLPTKCSKFISSHFVPFAHIIATRSHHHRSSRRTWCLCRCCLLVQIYYIISYYSYSSTPSAPPPHHHHHLHHYSIASLNMAPKAMITSVSLSQASDMPPSRPCATVVADLVYFV